MGKTKKPALRKRRRQLEAMIAPRSAAMRSLDYF
jgi:hypothetical protein